MTLRRLLPCLTLLWVAACARDAADPLDAFIEEQMAAGGIPGLAAALVDDGQIVWEGYYGYADLERRRRADAHTLFQVASISKTIVAARLMQLVETGRLDLDAPLSDYLGYPVAHPDFPATPVTARMLATHTSGLVDVFGTLARTTYDGDPPVSLAEFTEGYLLPGGAYYGDNNWGAEPGTAWAYSNAGFAVLGYVLERVDGRSLREQSDVEVFAPLGMTDSGWFLADIDQRLLATLYTYNEARHAHVPLDQVGYAHYPAGQLRTSVHDLSRFLTAFVRGGELDGTRILAEETVLGMWALQVPELSSRQALVFRYDTVAGRQYLGHSGATIGGSAQMLFRPEDGKGLLLMENGDSYVRARLGFEAGRDALEAILERLDQELDAAP